MKLIDCYNLYLGGKSEKNSFRNFVIIKHPVNNKKSIFYYSTGTSNEEGKNFPNCWFPTYMIEPYGKKYSKSFKEAMFSSDNYFGWIHKKTGLFLKLKQISRDKKEKNTIKKIFNIHDIDFFLNNNYINSENTEYNNILDIKKYIIFFNFLNKFKSWEELQISAFLSFTDKENLWKNNDYFKKILENVLKYTLKDRKFIKENLNGKDKIDLENVIVRKMSNLKDNNLCKGNFSKIIINEDKFPYPKRFLIFNNWLLENNIEETKEYFKGVTKHDLVNEVLEILKDKEFNQILKIYNENKDEYYKHLEDKRKENNKILEINMNEPLYQISENFKINLPIKNLKKASLTLKQIIKQNEIDINSKKIREEDKITIRSIPLSKIKKKLVDTRLKILNDYIYKNYEKVN